MESKLKILYLLKILQERTDEEHPLTTNQLIEILDKEYGISSHRETLKSDIIALQEFGIDVLSVRSKQTKYFIGSRQFELPELKLLIDAVESSKFITKKKSKVLIEKIYGLTNKEQVSKLKRNNYVADRIKPTNEKIYYIVDKINDAINANKQISFQYYEYNIRKRKVLRNKGERYILSPYNLVWNGDYYYVVGFSEKQNKIVTFRVDRINAEPDILNEVSLPKPKDFDLAEFTKETFFMFSGNEEVVELKCDNELMKTMIDRFGESIVTTPYNDDSFKLTTEVSVSPTFFGWIFGFGGRVDILGPERVKEEYKEMLLNEAKALK